jgi:competence protein ComEC
MAWLMELLSVVANFNWVMWQQFSPPVWAILLSLLGLIWLFLPKGFPLRFLGIAFSIPLVFNSPNAPLSSEMRLVVLDVGQGLSALIQTQHHALLYDTGTKISRQNDSGDRVIVPYLRSIGLDQLDGIVVSHNDIDHSGGLNSVLEDIPSPWILSSLPVPLNGASHIRCYKGQSWQWDGVKFEVLSPTLDSYEFDNIKDNNRSCVLRVTSPFGSVLLTGDIEREVENNLVDLNDGSLKSDVLIVPHHGSKTSSTHGFIDAVAPQVAIFAVGYRNRFGHPRPEVLERYKARNIQNYRSDKDGAVLVNFVSGNRFHVLPWRHEARKYWYD